MLIAILVILCAIVWTGIVCMYFRPEISAWLDNRYGPDRKKEKPVKKQFWRLYD